MKIAKLVLVTLFVPYLASGKDKVELTLLKDPKLSDTVIAPAKPRVASSIDFTKINPNIDLVTASTVANPRRFPLTKNEYLPWTMMIQSML